MGENKKSHKERGRKGGETTLKRYGHEYYQKIGKKGGKSKKMKPSDNHTTSE